MDNYIFPFLWMRGEKEEILREEIAKIHECGIGAVCVEARPHEDFCGPLWWRDMDIVLDEARSRGMKVWILDDKHFPTGYAAGLIETKYPERRKWYLADTTVDIFGTGHERTIHTDRMLKPVIGFWQLGEKANEEERKNNRLESLVAVRFSSENTFAEEAVDLTDLVRDGYVSFTLPEGQWRVHAIYRTRTDGGNEAYINMLDAESAHTQIEGVYEAHYRHYPEEFGKTIAGFFSDEPELGNLKLPRDDAKPGTPGIPLPWSGELKEMLKERWGDHYRRKLAFLFADADNRMVSAQIRYDYMDCVTGLYEKNFSVPVGNWCAQHNVEYIGHVVEDNGSHSRTGHGPGHYFRAMTGQDMAGIDVIGSQMIFGAPFQTRKSMGGMELDGEFFHYILGKMGASAGHLDPKKKGRTMCELFGAYGWNFGVRDMRYLLDQLLVRGVNHLVPHAFSMAPYPDPDCPPHFYARGNNGQFSWFAQLMKYANRMCAGLNGGIHCADVAVLYDAEADWCTDHMPMQKVGRILMQNQIEFDVVSLDMLNRPEQYPCRVENGKLSVNGVTFNALVVPCAPFIPQPLAEFAAHHRDFPVLFVQELPEGVLKTSPEEACDDPDLKSFFRVVQPEELPEYLASAHFRKICVRPGFEMLSVYHYRKAGQMFLFMNESAQEVFQGEVFLPTDQPLYAYDGDEDRYLSLESRVCPDVETDTITAAVPLILEPGQSILIVEEKQMNFEGILSAEKTWRSFRKTADACTKGPDLSGDWDVELCRPKEYPQACRRIHMETLMPVSDLDPAFSGIIRYRKSFELDQAPAEAVFRAESVFEVMRVSVNGSAEKIRMIPPYQIDLAGCLKEGVNEIVVEVANTPGRDQRNYPSLPFDFQHEAQEPSGMFGTIELKW